MTRKLLPHELNRLQSTTWHLPNGDEWSLSYCKHALLGSDFGSYLMQARKYIGSLPLSQCGLSYIRDDASEHLLHSLPSRCLEIEARIETHNDILKSDIAAILHDIMSCANPDDATGSWAIATANKIIEVLNLPAIRKERG
jgi:hypothetical protein